MGFAGLCAMHHMTAAENNQLCRSLLCPFCTRTTCWPYQFLTLQPAICWSIANSDMIPGTKPNGILCTPMSLAISAKASAQGMPPSSKHVAVPTCSFASTTTTSRCTRERKYAIPWLYVKSVWTRTTLTIHGSPLVATASATLAMRVLSQCRWSFSSSSSTVYSLKKVPALAPLTLKTSTLTLPCPSSNMFASKSWTSLMSSLTNTSLQV